MSTGGQAIGGVLGAVAGFFTPIGPMWGAQIGLMIGGYLDPVKTSVQGPRLDDLTVQTSTYGAVIPRIYGTMAVSGNVFWLENNKLKESETKTSSGGKGGGAKNETTAFSYSATFAVSLCHCPAAPIAGVKRIWIAGRLWYDAGSSDIDAIIASNASAEYFTLHTGSDTQLPDERMQATLGVANTPAYRGLAYIVFKDLPLADYGDSLMGAQVKVEVVTTGSVSALTRILQVDDTGQPLPFNNTIDKPYVTSLSDGVIRVGITNRVGDGLTQYLFSGHGNYIASETVAECPLSTLTAPLYSCGKLAGKKLSSAIYTGTNHTTSLLLDGVSIAQNLPTGHEVMSVFLANDGLSVVVLTKRPGDDAWSLLPRDWFELDETGEILRSGMTGFNLSNPTITSRAAEYSTYCGAYDSKNGTFGIISGVGPIYVLMWEIDPITNIVYGIGNSTFVPYDVYTYGSETLWIDGHVIYAFSKNRFNVFSFGPITPTSPTLASIITAEVAQSNLLTSADIDVTGLTQTVRGYRIASVSSLRSAIEPLQGCWPFDVVQHGYKILFKPRGSASVATIPAGDLDARAAGDSAGIAITNVREMDSQLPRKVRISFLDFDREYDTNEQSDERQTTDSVSIQSLDLAVVLTCGEAAGIAQVLLYLYWLERYDLNFRLPGIYNALEPGDAITVNADEATYSLRLTAITYTQDGRLECTSKYHSAAIYTPTAVGVAGAAPAQTLSIVGPTQLVLLDVPLLLDSADRPGYVAAMCGYLDGWTGGVIMRSSDAGQSWATLGAMGAPGSTIGTASNSIGAGRTDIFDAASALAVTMMHGTLSSVTELQVLNGANHFAYGANGRWEIIGAKNCTLQGDGSYILTDLLRGRRGSEWACGLHAVNDMIVALDSATLEFVGSNLDAIGLPCVYRGVTAGKSVDSASGIAFTYAGANLECLAPVYLNGDRNPSTNDWTLTWIRRTRIGGEWRDYVDATLGEASESYSIDVFATSAFATVKRTLTSTTPTVAYTSAQQVADFGSNQATLYLKIYQLSATVGRGYPLTGTITR